MKKLKSFLKGDLLGVHLAVNIFIATTVLWLLLRLGADTSPIWAVSAIIPALDPQMKQAVTNFRGRISNALLGCQRFERGSPPRRTPLPKAWEGEPAVSLSKHRLVSLA